MKQSLFCLVGCLVLSLRAYANYTVTVPLGSSLIANHLDRGDNSLNAVLPVVPDGTQVQKWNCSTYQTYTYDESLGSWSPSGGTLKPGEGAVIINSSGLSFNVTFSGTPHVPVCPLPLPCGCNHDNLVSRQTEAVGTYESITGLYPSEGAVLKRGVGAGQVVYAFALGTWTPSTPAVNLGEAVWVNVPCGSSSFNVSGIPNRSVACDTNWSFNTPSVTSLCCSNVNLTILSTVTNGVCPQTATRTWRATDCATNSATFSQTITVVDTTAPLLACASNKTVQCGSAWGFDAPFSADACCTNVTVGVLSTVTNGVCPQTITRTWSAVDCCNNSNTCNQVVTVEDNTPPVLTCAANKTVQCGSPWAFDPPTGSQTCCTNFTIRILSTVTNGSCPQVATRTWIAEDCCTNTAICSQVVIIADTTPPTLTCPTSKIVECGLIWTFDAPAASDACCTNVTLSVLSTVTNGSCPQLITRTWLGTDCCGLTNTCSQVVTVVDTTPPTISCPAAVTVACASQVPAPNTSAVSVSDNCGGTVAVTHVNDVMSASNCVNHFTLTRTYRATDACGNAATCAQTITVHDSIPPVITCPIPVTVSCASQVPPPNPSLVTASDNCDGVLPVTHVGDVISASNCVNQFTVRRSYRASDACGNIAQCEQLIIVKDSTPPAITCPANVTVTCAAQIPIPNPSLVTATDNCGGAVTITHNGDTMSASNCLNHFTLTRTYRASDACGNSATCTQTITVNDTTPPTITCPPAVTVTCALEVPTPNTGLVTASDNCAGVVTITHVGDTMSASNCLNHFTLTRTYRASDACGNSATCTQTITVNDTIPPTITCPANVTVSCASQVAAPNPNLVTATDNCGGPVTVTHVSDMMSASNCLNQFTLTRTYRATDACGNSATCSQTITVNDTIPPTITCPANVTVSCASLIPPATTTGILATDNCAGRVQVTHVSDTMSASNCVNRFTITRTYRAMDACGNSATCSQTINVNDATPPTINCPASVTVSCAAQVPVPSPTVSASDGCGGPVTVTHLGDAMSASNCVNRFTITRTYRATDVCGNTTTCNQIITANDTTPPTITCPAAVAVSCASQVPPPNTSLVTTSENCGGPVTITHVGDTMSASNCLNQFTLTRTYRATDVCGNSSTCTQVITVNDTMPPSVTCASGKTVTCGTAWTFDQPTASDLCCPTVTLTVLSTVTNGTGCPNLTVTRTWQATDCCGNASMCSQAITVLHNGAPPTLTCVGNKTVQCGSAWTFDSPAANDACCRDPVTVSVLSTVTNGAGCSFMATRAWQATDCCGLTATCTQIVSVVDSIPPVLTCPNNKTVECGTAWAFDQPSATDACCGANVTVTILSTVTNGAGCSLIATRTWQAMDCCGLTSTCSQTVTVVDTAPPVLTCTPNKTIEPSGGNIGDGPVQYTILRHFGWPVVGIDGWYPWCGLLEGNDGELYGTTEWGGSGILGTVFKLGQDGGGYEILHSFALDDTAGLFPRGGLLEGTEGMLYGTTTLSPSGPGTIFKLNKVGGDYQVVWRFTDGIAHGSMPMASLIEGSEGALYGMTLYGGVAMSGVVFKVNKDGSGFLRLHSFGSASGDGRSPWGRLLEGSDGMLYGTTPHGGTRGNGIVFRLSRLGDAHGYQVLHNFTGANGDGREPFGSLIESSDGNLYGTTCHGGDHDSGTIFKLDKTGGGYQVLTHFPLEPGGGVHPHSRLVEGVGGVLYGTTVEGGGMSPFGAVYRIERDGDQPSELHGFGDFIHDGKEAWGDLILGRDGGLYGTTRKGGRLQWGTVYRLGGSAGQSPWSFDEPTAIDSCCGNEVTLAVFNTVTNLNGPCEIDITRTWEATDCCGNTATCSQSVTLVDTTPPTIICAGNKTVGCSSDLNFDLPSAYDDGCANLVITEVGTVTNSLNPLVVRRTWQATDCCGNSSTCSQTLTALNSTPKNDECAGAVPITPGVPICGSTICATLPPNGSWDSVHTVGVWPPPDPNSPYGPDDPPFVRPPGIWVDVWYSFTPDCDGVLELNSCADCPPARPAGPIIINAFASVAGDCEELFSVGRRLPLELVCPTASRRQGIRIQVKAGVRFYFQILTEDIARGAFQLNSTFLLLTPTNDLCANAQVIQDGAYGFNNCSANNDGPSHQSCSINNDVWFRYTALCSGLVRVSTCRSGFDTVLAVYSGSCGNLSPIRCNDNATTGFCAGSLTSEVTFDAVIGTSYCIRVGSASGQGGPGILTIHPPSGSVPTTCPPPTGAQTEIRRAFRIIGNPLGFPWSWSISVSCCVELYSPHVPGVASGDADNLARAFAQDINDACPSGAVRAEVVNKAGLPPVTTPGIMLIKVRCGSPGGFTFRVGGPNTTVENQCDVEEVSGPDPLPVHPPCTFNPAIIELPLSNRDQNGNGEDDTIDILTGTSQDVNHNGVPDEVEACMSPLFVTGGSLAFVRRGENLSLSAAAIGSSPLAYQWYRDGIPLTNAGQVSGATSTNLTIATVTAADAGDYTVEVTNACGAITNIPVTVTTFGPTAPRILNPRRVGDQFQFSFATETNATYLVEFSDDLSLPLWFPMEFAHGDGSVHDTIDPFVSPWPRFYRVTLLVP